jgi:hypothetical protein
MERSSSSVSSSGSHIDWRHLCLYIQDMPVSAGRSLVFQSNSLVALWPVTLGTVSFIIPFILVFFYSSTRWIIVTMLVPILRAFNYWIHTTAGSRDSSVGIALSYGLDDRGSRVRFPAGVGNFSLHHRVQNGSGALPASYPMGTRGSFPGE